MSVLQHTYHGFQQELLGCKDSTGVKKLFVVAFRGEFASLDRWTFVKKVVRKIVYNIEN